MAGTGYMLIQAKESTDKQVSIAKKHLSSEILRESLEKELSNINNLVTRVGPLNSSSLRNCLPSEEVLVGQKIEQIFGNCSIGSKMQLNLEASKGFQGVKEGTRVLRSGKPTFFDHDGSPCKRISSKSCVLAVAAVLTPICTSSDCSNGPDLLNIAIEFRDHLRDKTKPFSQKSLVQWKNIVHDMEPFKGMAIQAVNDEDGCKNVVVDGFVGEQGYPVAIKNGKIVCAFYRPQNYIGITGPPGPRGYNGYQGDRGRVGRSCNGTWNVYNWALTPYGTLTNYLIAMGCPNPGNSRCQHVTRKEYLTISGC